MLTAHLQSKGSEYEPYIEDEDGRRSYAPVRFFSEDEAMQYAEFAIHTNRAITYAPFVAWPAIAQWK